MTPYLSIYFLVFITTVFYEKDLKYKKEIFFIVLFYVFSFCAIRLNVGGDWKRYLYLYNETEEMYEHIAIVFLKKEFLFEIISYTTYHLFNNIFANNLVFSIIFFISLMPFMLSRNNPSFWFLLFIPLGVFVLHLGFIRQSLALSLIFNSIYFFEKNKLLTSLIFLLASTQFHLSALIFVPFFLIMYFVTIIKLNLNYIIINTITVFITIIIFIGIKFNVLIGTVELGISETQLRTLDSINSESKIYSLVRSYILKSETVSFGLYFRIIPTILSLFLFLVFFDYFKKSKSFIWLNYNFYFVLTVFVAILFNFYTLADRLNYYTLPFVISVFIIFYDRIDNDIAKKIYFYLINFLFFLILFIWLFFSQYSRMNWQFYQTVF